MVEESNYTVRQRKLNPAFWNGLFICFSIVLLWWGYNYIRGARIDEGFTIQVKFEDILENNILQNLKNKGKVENLESKLRKSITKEIKLLWGKKPFVEIFLHYK